MNPKLKAAVADMCANDGIYVMTLPEKPNEVVPMFVNNGIITAMVKAQELSRDGFMDGVRIEQVWTYPKP